MILRFQDAAVLSRVVDTVLPKDLAAKPVEVAMDGSAVLIKTTTRLSKATTNAIVKLGVGKITASRKLHNGKRVSSWYVATPVLKVSVPQAVPAIYLVPSTELTKVMTPQASVIGWRDNVAVVHAKDPQYHILLRAADREGGLSAYVQRAQGVWVIAGYDHPFANKFKVTQGKLSLLSLGPTIEIDAPPAIPNGAAKFELTGVKTKWSAADDPKPIQVPVQLLEVPTGDPSLWVVSIEVLRWFVENTFQKILERLQVAFTKDFAVIKRPAKNNDAPLVLEFPKAEAFVLHRAVADLYVPFGTKLFPLMRRDVVKKVLEVSNERVVWLARNGKTRFSVQSVPIAGFVPLADIPDYQVPVRASYSWSNPDHEPFPFLNFFNVKEKEEKPAETKPVPVAKPVLRPLPVKKDTDLNLKVEQPTLPSFIAKPPSEWRIRREKLEEEFLGLETPIDDPGRRDIWVALAEANTGEGRAIEASMCHAHAGWLGTEESLPQLEAWVSCTGYDPETMNAAKFDKLMSVVGTNRFNDLSHGLIWLLWINSKTDGKPPKWVITRLPEILKYVETKEIFLPIRLTWLVSLTVATLAGNDILGLARCRDRLLLRLLDKGPDPEVELPQFLRISHGELDTRVAASLPRINVLCDTIQKWSKQVPLNKPYVSLICAFMYAKLGDYDHCQTLLKEVNQDNEKPDPSMWKTTVRSMICQAYQYRIHQACTKTKGGPLPEDWLKNLEKINAAGKKNGADHDSAATATASILEVRQTSKIIDTQQYVDVYAQWMSSLYPLVGQVEAIVSDPDPQKLAADALKLLQTNPKEHPRLLRGFLPVASRVNEEFTRTLIGLVPAAVNSEACKQQVTLCSQILNYAMLAAGHYGLDTLADSLVDLLVTQVNQATAASRAYLVGGVAGPTMRILRKVGLVKTTERLVAALAKAMDINQLDPKKSYPPTTLQAAAAISSGWLALRHSEKAMPNINVIRDILLGAKGPRPDPHNYAKVATAYLSVVASLDDGIDRMVELFEKMPAGVVANALASSIYFARYHLDIVDAAVAALVGDSGGLSEAGKKWLDDDEYVIRKRIHADVAKVRTLVGI